MSGGCSFNEGGDQDFFQKSKGGPEFFPVGKGGDQNFFAYAKGGPEKNWRPAITDRRSPLPLKNDSSLNTIRVTYTSISVYYIIYCI